MATSEPIVWEGTFGGRGARASPQGSQELPGAEKSDLSGLIRNVQKGDLAQTPVFFQQFCLALSFRVHGSAPTSTVPDACAQKLRAPGPAPRAPKSSQEPKSV